MAISRKTNKSGVSFDPAQRSIMFAEDWNNMGDQVEGLLGRVGSLETTGSPGSRQASFTASSNPTMNLNITSGVECSIVMNANASLQLAYTSGASNYAVLYIRNQPGGQMTWPNMLWDTADGTPPPLAAGDGLMTVIGIYERFGVVRGFLIDTRVRVSDPAALFPVTGGVLQLKLDEGQGMPQDSTGSGNHVTVSTGVWAAGGGMTFASGAHARTPYLTGFNIKQSWWLFEVFREINLSINPGHFGTLSGFSGGTDNEFTWHYLNQEGDGVAFSARSPGSENWSQHVLPNSAIAPLAYRTAIVWVYDAAIQRYSQYVLHNNSRVGHALIPNGLQWVDTKAVYNLSGLYRVGTQTHLSTNPTRKEYVFLKQGVPTEQELTDTYTFARNLMGSRPGDNLPALT